MQIFLILIYTHTLPAPLHYRFLGRLSRDRGFGFGFGLRTVEIGGAGPAFSSPTFGRHTLHHHLPVGAAERPAHARWNHSSGQSSFCQVSTGRQLSIYVITHLATYHLGLSAHIHQQNKDSPRHKILGCNSSTWARFYVHQHDAPSKDTLLTDQPLFLAAMVVPNPPQRLPLPPLSSPSSYSSVYRHRPAPDSSRPLQPLRVPLQAPIPLLQKVECRDVCPE
jgi:hypothetical protein